MNTSISSGLIRFIKRTRRPFAPTVATGAPFWFLRSRKGHVSFSNLAEVSHLVERLASCLETCRDLNHLRKIHACVFARGLGENIFLGSKLLNCYASLGSLQDSRWVFGRIINRTPSLWNSALVGYFRAGHLEEVLRLFLELKWRGIDRVDGSAHTFALKSCKELGVAELGRAIHADALKVGLNGDTYVGSSLVGLYSQLGFMEDAHQVFEEISEKDLVVYTSMVTAYAQLADFRAWRAFQIVGSMQREEGIDPNRVTLVSLLQAAGHVGAFREGSSVHCYAIRRGIGDSDEVLETSLMDMYIRFGARKSVASIFSAVKGKSIVSWNAMIGGLVRFRQPFQALEIFSFMKKEENTSPDQITLANVLLACNDLKYFLPARSIHGYSIRMEIPLDLVLTTALIDAYSQNFRMEQARKLFDKLALRDIVSYNVIISGCLQSGQVYESIELLNEMIHEGIQPNTATILSLLPAFADLANISIGRCIHGYVVRHILDPIIEVSNQLVHMYAKCGYMHISREIFNRMNDRDLVSWTTMMMGYVSCGHGDEAIALFRLMQKFGERPDSVTLIGLLQGLSQLDCLKEVKETHGFIYRCRLDTEVTLLNSLVMTYSKCGKLDVAIAVFNGIMERELVSWNTMITAYGMHGCCREAIDLFHLMQEENVRPDAVTFTSLLSACSHAGLVQEGWSIFRSMNAEYFIPPNEEHYACMVDLLARAGNLEEAFDFIKQVPLRNNTTALSALLSACRVHGNTKLGGIIGRELLEVDPHNSSNYSLASNICAVAGKWSEAANLRAIAGKKVSSKIPGYSVIEDAI